MQRRHHQTQHHDQPETLSNNPFRLRRHPIDESPPAIIRHRRSDVFLHYVARTNHPRKIQPCFVFTCALNVLAIIYVVLISRKSMWLLEDKFLYSFGAISLSRRGLRSESTYLVEEKNVFPKTAFMTAQYERSSIVSPAILQPIPHFLAPDYGGLQIMSLSVIPFKRRIPANEAQKATRYRRQILDLAEKIKKSPFFTPFDDLDWPRKCVRPAWTYRTKPTCNTMHEMQLETNGTQYLGHGYFRDTWLVQQHSNHSRFVLKRLRYVHNGNLQIMSPRVLTEAIVMDAMTSSPVVTNIYSHCATSLAVEAANELTHLIVPHVKTLQKEHGRISRAEYEALSREEPFSFNNLTTIQKLDIAVQMAEGLAESHGYKYGVIVNDDVHPDQWLITDDNRVVLNDMNNAVFLSWSYEKSRYCRYWISYGGDYRAPEEYEDDGSYVNESADVYAMGNLIHSLLTGLWPYHDMSDSEDIQEKALAGEAPYLDPRFRTRSFIEKRMSEIMDQCHKLNPKERVDIFEVVRYLRETKAMYQAVISVVQPNSSTAFIDER